MKLGRDEEIDEEFSANRIPARGKTGETSNKLWNVSLWSVASSLLILVQSSQGNCTASPMPAHSARDN